MTYSSNSTIAQNNRKQFLSSLSIVTMNVTKFARLLPFLTVSRLFLRIPRKPPLPTPHRSNLFSATISPTPIPAWLSPFSTSMDPKSQRWQTRQRHRAGSQRRHSFRNRLHHQDIHRSTGSRYGSARRTQSQRSCFKISAGLCQSPAHNGKQIILQTLPPRTPASHSCHEPIRKDGKEQYDSYTADKMYAFLSSYSLRDDPGTKFQYSNLGMSLLGHVMERISRTNSNHWFSIRISARSTWTAPASLSHRR